MKENETEKATATQALPASVPDDAWGPQEEAPPEKTPPNEAEEESPPEQEAKSSFDGASISSAAPTRARPGPPQRPWPCPRSSAPSSRTS